MRAVPMLVIKSIVPCLLYANNAPVGEISEDHPAGLPMPENGRCYIHYVPLTLGRIPGAFRLDFTAGQLTTPDGTVPARLVRWPRGVVEAEILPETSASNGFLPVAPDTLSHIDLSEGNRAYLLRYVTNWLVVEDSSGNTMLSVSLPNGRPELQLLDLEGRQAVAARSQGVSDWVVICAADADEWKELFRVSSARVDVDRSGEVTSLLPLGDTTGHARLTTWTFSGGQYTEQQNIVWFDGDPKIPQTPEDTGRAFLEAWALGLTGEAMEYLSHDLSGGLSEPEIHEFLGAYERIEAARYAPICADGEITLALVRREGEGLFGARPLAIRCVEEENDKGKWKIDNIRPL
jgi:hypothetical protein